MQEAFKFYYKAIELKEMLRQGAVQWNVKADRLESIAEHTYGCMVLAIALHSELNIKVDLGKTLEMLAIHELEEIAIGDVTPLDQIDKKSLKDKARKFVYDFVKDLNQCEKLMDLTDEYNQKESQESLFANAVDKLECVLQFKKWQDLGHVSLANLTQDMLKNKKLKGFVDSGKYDLADIFFIYHKSAYEPFGINEDYWFKTLKNIKV